MKQKPSNGSSAGGLVLMEGSSEFKEKSKFKMGLEEEKVENRNKES